MNSAYLMGGIIAQIFSLSTLLAIFLGIVLKSRPIVNILCVLTSLIEVGIVSVLNNGTSGRHIYISSIIFSLIIGNLVLSSRRLSSNKKKSKRSENTMEESFVDVSFSAIEDCTLNNSKDENALAGLLIFYIAKKNLDQEMIDSPMKFNPKMKFNFCDHIFKKFNLITNELNTIIDNQKDKNKKNRLLEFKHALHFSLLFIYGLLTMNKKSEINLILSSWKIIFEKKQFIQLELFVENLPSFFNYLLNNYQQIRDQAILFNPYFASDQYDIDLKNNKKDNFDKLKRDAKSIISDSIGIGGNLFKKIIPGSKNEENLATDEKLEKINQMRNNNTITESEYQQMRVQILNKFTGSNSEEGLSTNDEMLKETTKGIDDEITDLEDFDNNLKSGIMFTVEFIDKIILNPIKFTKEGKLPDGFWQDEYLLGFLSYLIINTCDSLVDMSDISREDKGMAIHLIMAKLCLQESKQVMDDFNRLVRNPTEDSQRGHDLSMKFLSIADNTYEIAFPNDPDIKKAKKISESLERGLNINIKNMDMVQNQNLFLAFQIIYLNEYILKMYK